MEKIIETGELVKLYTSMSEQDFAKANMMQHMKAEGYIAEESPDGSFVFSKWFFENTALEDNKFILTGPAFTGKNVYQILKEVEESCKDCDISNKANETQISAWKYIFRVIKAMQKAIEQKINLPDAGAIGIICSEDGKILFLPELLITRSIAMRSQKEAAEFTESWRQPILPIEQMPSFSAAVMIYTVLTGKRPFNAAGPEQLSEDFLDNYFIPSEYVCSISKENAEVLNTALKGKIKFRPSLKRLLKIFREDISSLYINGSKTAESTAKEKAVKKLTSKINRIRYFRHHFTQISIAGIAILIFAGITISIINNEAERPTTKGLTSFQVVESFYSALNHLDTTNLDECISKDAGKQIKNVAATLFVTSKMQSAYNQGQGFFTPAQWIIKASPDKTSVFGITHLKINGINSSSSADWMENNLKIPLDIKKGSKESFQAEYFLVMTEDPENITVSLYNDSLELTFQKDKWIITKYDRNSTTTTCNKAEFFEDLANKDTASYDWFPSEEELNIGKAELQAQVVVF